MTTTELSASQLQAVFDELTRLADDEANRNGMTMQLDRLCARREAVRTQLDEAAAHELDAGIPDAGTIAYYRYIGDGEAERDLLSQLLRGMARRASNLRRTTRRTP